MAHIFATRHRIETTQQKNNVFKELNVFFTFYFHNVNIDFSIKKRKIENYFQPNKMVILQSFCSLLRTV